MHNSGWVEGWRHSYTGSGYERELGDAIAEGVGVHLLHHDVACGCRDWIHVLSRASAMDRAGWGEGPGPRDREMTSNPQ